MSKAVSRGQALQVASRVGTQVSWDELDGEVLQKEVIDLSPEEFGIRFTEFLKSGARVHIGSFFTITNELAIQIPALPHPTLDELQKKFSFVKSVEKDTSPTESVILKLATVLKTNENSINGKEYETRLALSSDTILGYQQAAWLVEHQDEFPELMALLGKVYIDFPGLVVLNAGGYRHIPYLYRDGKRGGLYWDWVGRGFGRGGRVAVSGK